MLRRLLAAGGYGSFTGGTMGIYNKIIAGTKVSAPANIFFGAVMRYRLIVT